MITIPAIGRAVPSVYTTAHEDAAAARCALLLAPEGPLAPIRGRKAPVEIAQLEHLLHTWTSTAIRELRIFKPKLHLCVDRAPSCECCTQSNIPMSLWVINQNGEAWGSTWRLDRRWQELQRQAPGIPAAALEAIQAASGAGLPIFHPFLALAFCSWNHWMGEDNEKEAIGSYGHYDSIEEAKKDGFPTREWLDGELPPIAKAARRAMSRDRLARSWGPRRDVARAILDVYAAIKSNNAPKGAPTVHVEGPDDYCCVGSGVTLRWRPEDPMDQIYDDYVNGMYESHHVQEHYGWYPISNTARQLRPALAAIEARFKVARAAEKLIELIAEEYRQ